MSRYKTDREYRERVKAASLARYRQLGPDAKRKRNAYSIARTRKYLYGITVEEYDAMLKAQNFSCAICETRRPGRKRGSSSDRPWSVDHNHRTGKVRGLLCARCNSALGMVGDDESVLALMIEYLARK